MGINYQTPLPLTGVAKLLILLRETVISHSGLATEYIADGELLVYLIYHFIVLDESPHGGDICRRMTWRY